MWGEVVIESSTTKTSKTGDIPTPVVTASASRPTGTVLTRVMPALSTTVRATATTPRSVSSAAISRARWGSPGPCTGPSWPSPGAVGVPGRCRQPRPAAVRPPPAVATVTPACEHQFVSVDGATILHADLDAFYASVEQRDFPRLRGRPVIVGGGVVLAASYEAKAFGVRTAMGAGQARRLCPMAVVVRPRIGAYAEASRAVFAVFDDTTPLVEGLSIDEAFLDVGGLRRSAGPPEGIAEGLRRAVRERVGLAITVGVARTKFLAKVASGVAKPDGLLVVAPDAELAFLHPLAVERLWGVGRVTAAKLRGRGITTVGEVAALPEAVLVSMLGPASGRHLHALAHNRDPRPVPVGPPLPSVGSHHALGRPPGVAGHPPPAADAVLVGLVDRVP